MADEWNTFVTVRFPGKEDRKVPLGQWNDGLADRVLRAGGEFILPRKPDAPPRPSKFFLKSAQGEEDQESDDGIKELMLDLDPRNLNDFERKFMKSITKRSHHVPLTVKQVRVAMRIIEKHGKHGKHGRRD